MPYRITAGRQYRPSLVGEIAADPPSPAVMRPDRLESSAIRSTNSPKTGLVKISLWPGDCHFNLSEIAASLEIERLEVVCGIRRNSMRPMGNVQSAGAAYYIFVAVVFRD